MPWPDDGGRTVGSREVIAASGRPVADAQAGRSAGWLTSLAARGFHADRSYCRKRLGGSQLRKHASRCRTGDPFGADQLTLMLRRVVEAHSEANQAGAVRAVIVVDQLEELFTLCADEQERRVFIDWLWGLSKPGTDERPLALVVCGLRADFYAECANYPQLRGVAGRPRRLWDLCRLQRSGRRSFTQLDPAGLDIEAGLVELLLRDLGVTENPVSRAEVSRGRAVRCRSPSPARPRTAGDLAAKAGPYAHSRWVPRDRRDPPRDRDDC